MSMAVETTRGASRGRDAGRPGLRHGRLPGADGRDPARAGAARAAGDGGPRSTLTLVTGRITEPDGLAYWESLDGLPRSELPVRTRNALRWWRVEPWPPVEWWSGAGRLGLQPGRVWRADPPGPTGGDQPRRLAERPVRAARARRAAGRVFGAADLILSVSRFNTEQLLECVPGLPGHGRVRPQRRRRTCSSSRPTERERASVAGRPGAAAGRALPALGGQLPAAEEPAPGWSGRRPASPRWPRGELALVLLGTGSERRGPGAPRGGRGGRPPRP